MDSWTGTPVGGGGGVNLMTYAAGDPAGPPIVFVHGFTASHLFWVQQLSGSLAEEFRLIAYDLRGHGASDKSLDAEHYMDSRMWAEDLAAVIHANELDRPVLVGHSYGGTVIADYLRAYGDDEIGGLVLVGAASSASLSEELLAIFDGLLSPELATSVDSTRRLHSLQTAEPMHQDAFEINLGAAMVVLPVVRQGMLNRELDADDVLATIEVPTLVVHGTDDRLVRLIGAEHIAETVPGAALHAYEGAAHAPFLDDPKRFDADLAEFVRATRD